MREIEQEGREEKNRKKIKLTWCFWGRGFTELIFPLRERIPLYPSDLVTWLLRGFSPSLSLTLCVLNEDSRQVTIKEWVGDEREVSCPPFLGFISYLFLFLAQSLVGSFCLFARFVPASQCYVLPANLPQWTCQCPSFFIETSFNRCMRSSLHGNLTVGFLFFSPLFSHFGQSFFKFIFERSTWRQLKTIPSFALDQWHFPVRI